MKNSLGINKEQILKIITICIILYLSVDIVSYICKFALILIKDIKNISLGIHGSNFAFLVNYLDAVNIKSYKCYLIFSYLSKLPFYILKVYISYNFIKFMYEYKDSLFKLEIKKRIISIYNASLLYLTLRYIYLLIDAFVFNKVFINNDRVIYYFNTIEFVPLVIFMIFMMFYFLAEKEKTKIVEVKSKTDFLDRIINFLKNRI